MSRGGRLRGERGSALVEVTWLALLLLVPLLPAGSLKVMPASGVREPWPGTMNRIAAASSDARTSTVYSVLLLACLTRSRVPFARFTASE